MVRILPACRRPCWRLVPRKAFFLRQGTPTRPEFSRLAGALVGALFPAKPLSFVGTRQHGPNFPSLPTLLLAPCSPQSLYLSSGRANTVRFSPAHRCPCCYNFRKKRRRKRRCRTPPFPMERVKGIEPSTRAWEARVLPLNYTRKTYSFIILQLRTAVKPFGLTAAAL